MPRASSDPERVLQRLDWTVLKRLDGLLQGDYRTFFRGFGFEMAELREYQFTDDVRTIDWNVTARMQEPWVRLFVEDRDITAWFLLDVSPSVDFGPRESADRRGDESAEYRGAAAQKRDLLVDFTAVLARVLTRHGNKVGALLFTGRETRVIPAKGGRMHVLQLIRELREQPPLPRAPRTDLAALLDSTLRMVRRRSLLFIISDFLSVPGWDRRLTMMAHRHETLAVRLVDPREGEFPDVGPVVLEDSETGEQIFVDTHDRGFRKRYAALASARREELQATLRRAGVDLLELSTDGDMARDIVRFSSARAERRAAHSSRALARPRAG